MNGFREGGRANGNGSYEDHTDKYERFEPVEVLDPSALYAGQAHFDETPAASPTFQEMLAKGNQTAAITFAGQGAWDLNALGQWMLRSKAVYALISAASEKIEGLLQQREFRWTGKYEHGFDLVAWATKPESRPSTEYLRSARISQPMIFIQQIACYQMLWEEGLREALQKKSVSVLTGHSQGIMAALLVSESPEGVISLERFLDYSVYMLHQGRYMEESYAALVQATGESDITPMAAVSGPTYEQLEQVIARVMGSQPTQEKVTIALRNTRLRHVLSGPSVLLEQIRQVLDHLSAKESQRKKEGRLAGKPLSVVWEYLMVEAPYHSPYMENGLQPMRDKLEEMGFAISADDFHIDVLSPHSGMNFRTHEDPLELVLQDQFINSVEWPQTLQKILTHRVEGSSQTISMVLDLGPSDGVSRLTYSVLKGTGVRVLPLSVPAGREDFFVRPNKELPQPLRYDAYMPTHEVMENGKHRVVNRYTEATGHTPMILPGMTPTTADVGIVAAAANAGFTSELAGGGQVTEKMFWLRMEELREQLEPGREIVFNALFLDPYLWGLHFRKEGLVQKARAAGYPICGVTISAGIPEVDEAVSLLKEFQSLGMWLNAFKPGTMKQVKQVIQIAQAVPEQTIFVHLEGGKAGGHHSWENLDDLLLDCYHMLRSQPNLVLCVGGGVGTEERSTALLTGTWSAAYDLIPMPVDAVFLGTLAMACLEAETSPQVKQALVDAAGFPGWVMYGEYKHGLTSGKSALNADIHYLDNPAARCGSLLDKVAGKADEVAQRRDEIIDALNATAKPYFGDLEEMTYYNVAQRMLTLMAVGRHGRYEDGCWPDISFRARWSDFVQRTEARLCAQEEGSFPSIIQDLAQLDQPEEVLTLLLASYPEVESTVLHPADVQFFLSKICARPGKPVNFVPVIDESVRRWYKADSLWQAHDDRFEANQVLIIPGPEAVAGLTQLNEPIGELLGRFTEHVMNALEPTHQESNRIQIPAEFTWKRQDNKLTIVAENPEDPTAWFSMLYKGRKGPLAELFRSSRIVVGQRSLPNPVHTLFKAKSGASLTIEPSAGRQLQAVTYRPIGACSKEEIKLTYQGNKGTEKAPIKMELFIPSLSDEKRTPYTIYLTPEPMGDSYCYRQTEQERGISIRDFYHHVLFGELLEPTPLFVMAEEKASLSLERVRAYHAITGGHGRSKHIPVNMMFSLVWKPLFRTLSCDELVGDIMHLVHLSNRVTMLEHGPVQPGEQVTVQSQITRLEDSLQGRRIYTTSMILRDNQPCASVDSAFFIRGSFAHTSFATQAKESMEVNTPIVDQGTWDFVREHVWIKWLTDVDYSSDMILDWSLELQEQKGRESTHHYKATGVVQHQGQLLGTIDLEENSQHKLHPVRVLLDLLGTNKPVRYDTKRCLLAQEEDHTPHHLDTFAEVSRDGNPIHRSELIAQLGGLEQTIVHGMWTAARLGQFLVQHVAGGQEKRLQHVHAEFLSYSFPGEHLVMEATRTGVLEGDLLVEATAFVIRGSQKLPVVRLESQVKAPRAAYVFPGQGIQQKGMGMTGYARSKAARDVWDRSDVYTRRNLGFSILHIVRDNPNEVIVQGESHVHPKGVIHLTQFTQVAMAVLAQAQMAEMKEVGIHRPDAIICGHSVGEYNAIAATGVLPLESVVELVYQRGLAMHVLVKRNAQGESGYGMAVIRPHYAKMSHAQAEDLVQQVTQETGHFLQIVNYNVKGRQYSVTGRTEALHALQQELAKRETGTKPAYIEIPGIDVPFHSSVLREGVATFRNTLDARFPEQIDYVSLLGRYIPNLVPRPFTLELSYLQEVADYTQSPVLLDVVADFASWKVKPAALARVLLIELLAWQFASPVRWIETQDLLFTPESLGGMGIDQMIEVGVGYQPTLANMARYTLKLLGSAAPDVAILNVEAEAEQVFFQDEGSLEEYQIVTEEVTTEVAEATASTSTPVKAEVAVAAVPSASYEPIEDRMMTAAEALHVLLAVQAKVRLEQINSDETIDELFDGVSSRRNQVLLDLGAEFNMGPIDGAHEKPLHQLAAEVEKRASSYKAPGKYLRATQDEAIKRVMGRAGFNRKDIVDYLDNNYGMGEGLSTTALMQLVLETREGQSKRGEMLGRWADTIPANKTEAQALLDQTVTRTSQVLQIPLPKKTQGGGASGMAVDAAVVQELEERLLGPSGVLMNTAKQLAEQLGHSFENDTDVLANQDEQAERLDLWEKEHGADYEQWIRPCFDVQKHVALTSSWAWISRDIAELYYDVTNERIDLKEAQQRARRLVLHHQEKGTQETARWYALQAQQEGFTALSQLLEAVAVGQSIPCAPCIPSRPNLTIANDGSLDYNEMMQEGSDAYQSMISQWLTQEVIKVKGWNDSFHEVLQQASEAPLNFKGETALVTGASPGSIAVACVRHLLRGGARVVVTTSTYNSERIRYYRSLYEQEAAPGAELHIVPFNQSSFQDVEALVAWLFDTVSEQSGADIRVLKRPFAPSLFLPFAAVKDLATLDNLGPRSNVVMRAMLLSVERMIAAIATRYQEYGLPALPCHVVLPLSPNHGTFGGDGVYAETKAALEVLQQKWHSEYDAWGRAVTLCAARIGWVRGTGLMDANNPVAAYLEERTGVTTFSSDEMGLLLSALSTTAARQIATQAPLEADLSGGFAEVKDLKEVVDQIRTDIDAQQQRTRRKQSLFQTEAQQLLPTSTHITQPHALPQWPIPTGTSHTNRHNNVGACGSTPNASNSTPIPNTTPLSNATSIHNNTPTPVHNDALLSKTVVIVGMGEVGPCGSSRTRFELEVGEEISAAGILELAWVTGLLTYEDSGRGGVWKDTETEEEVAEWEIASRYRDAVRERVGVRFCEQDTLGFAPQALPVFSSVYLEKDFTFPVTSAEEAKSFVQMSPELTQARYDGDSDTWLVTRKAGSEVRVPRQARLSRHVAGMVPQGFDFERYGIPKDMLDQVDRVSLFNLVATVDAFVSAGLSPEELMQWVHPARVANTQGSGIGGMQSLKRLYQDHILGQERQSDILQETLINVVAAYVVQSYVGSYGAMSHPVAACATAAVSLEDGMDKILAGKADFVVTGGYDDLGEAGMIGFGDMNATADTDQMLAMGFEPSQMSRANDERRRGFVESQGGGTVLLARGDVALRMGLPIQGVLGYAASFGDGIHKSIPAPGMGALASAMGGEHSPLAQALQQYGLSADDIAMVYKHDTSTAANDPNENQLHHRIQKALGRTPGNPLFVVSQKTLTGHPKGGAAAWQIIGLCQALQQGVIPGNRNLDSVDAQMKPYAHMAFNNRSLHTGSTKLRAGLVTSLGFGHVSGISLILHPDTFVSLLSPEQKEAYLEQAQARNQQAQRDWANIQMGRKQAFVKRSERRFEAADGTSIQADEEAAMLLHPEARLLPSQRYSVMN